MVSHIDKDTWVWVVVQDPGGDEQFLGQYDEAQAVAFIPTFYSKEDAQNCFMYMTREKGRKYEVQAVVYEDLARDAAENGFEIFMLDADGQILDRLRP
jgi:hypothetical protein